MGQYELRTPSAGRITTRALPVVALGLLAALLPRRQLGRVRHGFLGAVLGDVPDLAALEARFLTAAAQAESRRVTAIERARENKKNGQRTMPLHSSTGTARRTASRAARPPAR
jgi:hypothetical protein